MGSFGMLGQLIDSDRRWRSCRVERNRVAGVRLCWRRERRRRGFETAVHGGGDSCWTRYEADTLLLPMC